MQRENKGIDLAALQQTFEKSADVHFQTYEFRENQVILVTCEAMVDEQMLNFVVVPRIQQVVESFDSEESTSTSIGQEIEANLHIPDLKKVDTLKSAIKLIFTGHVLLFFEESGLLYTSNIANLPNRKPEETRVEAPIRGPRDNFIEDLSVNIALIRKRLPTNSLCVEKFTIGKRSKTSVALLYFDDIASKDTLNGIRKQLKQVDTDIVFSGDLLMESVNKTSVLFPRIDYTGRPDKSVQALVRGRFLIIVDGVAYAIITPVNLLLLLKTSEDNDNTVIFSSFERLLRLFGMTVGLVLPAFWLALTTFHQDQLPLRLLATVILGNTGLPFPSAVEMLLMVIMFELLREGGLRLPIPLGGTIGVVGGLIIGDAAIRAGITSPAMVVVIAISTVSTFTLVNQSIVTSISILRICFIILTAFLGLFGFFMSIYFTLLYLANIRIFGVPYINIATDLSIKTITKSLLRMPIQFYKERPEMLNPTDRTRRKGAEEDE